MAPTMRLAAVERTLPTQESNAMRRLLIFLLPLVADCLVAQVTFQAVSHRYPDSWQRKLFSSEPRRPWALESITLHLEGLVLLTGPSMCGKSTLLRLIRGTETPTEGSIQVDGTLSYLLDSKPLPRRARSPEKEWLYDCMGLTEDGESPSQLYLRDAVEACCAPDQQPILLLDEWLDTEPTSIVHKVQEGLERLVHETGALVVCVTHYPERWKPCAQVSLRSGKMVEMVDSRKQ